MAYQSIAGKLAGLGAARSDPAYSAYLADHQAWEAEHGAQNAVVARNSARESSYYQSFTAWQQKQRAYNQAVMQRAMAVSQRNAALRDNAATVAARYGVALPAGFVGCVSPLDHDTAVAQCQQASYQTVKGLGGGPSGWPPCAIAQLPVCPADIPMPTAPPPPPARSALERVPSLRPEPQPPPLPGPTVTPPSTGPAPPSSPPIVTSTIPPTTSMTPPPVTTGMHQAGLGTAGLVLLVVAGGGYALYRTFRKQKASA